MLIKVQAENSVFRVADLVANETKVVSMHPTILRYYDITIL